MAVKKPVWKTKNPNKKSKGVTKLLVNGKEVQGNIIPFSLSGDEFEVQVIL